MIGITLASLIAANPIARALATPQNHQVQVDLYVDNIPENRLSQSFYQDENHGLFVTVTEKAKEFYSTIGQKYGLSGVNLTFNLCQLTDGNYPNLDRNHLAVSYLDVRTVDLTVFSRIVGLEESYLAWRQEDLDKYTARGVDRKEAEKIIERTHRGVFIDEFYDLGHLYHGLAFNGKNKAILFSTILSDQFDEQTIIKTCFSNLIHELGHLFSLEHPDPKYASEINNVMGLFPENLTDFRRLISTEPAITREQVQQINAYLNQTE
ncbi:MAG: hypothetical protein KJ896_05020 [Nanoarchaeota archaeon]|nr:hypothetical protein [Nanoarchaeota archaeon]